MTAHADGDGQPDLEEFTAGYPFQLDDFQREAIGALRRDRSVLVAAPTGAGKTVVGEYACHHAVGGSGKCFYTTPIKALSNQKHHDLVQRHGEEAVGLLTGDRAVNGDAPIVVMTTEVLRNMIYETSPALEGLQFVVLDEVHYLADRARGAVWEEVIVQLPGSVQIAALSATVSNAEEFGQWLAEARHGCEVVISEQRPVPLTHHYYVDDRIYDTFRAAEDGGSREQRRAAQALSGEPNPDVLMLERRARRRSHGRGRRLRWPDRPQVVAELRDRRWLPAIIFVFSRQGCDDAAATLSAADLGLTTPAERERIGELTDEMLGGLPPEDLRVLDYPRFRTAMMDGIAPHHAGMVPAFKEAVETCFQRGLLKVVVATETLALGINMPARTVVIERLEKWDGQQHAMLTPGDYTQLTGRAGRRGIDRVGHAVVLYQRDIDFRTVAGLVGTRTYPLSSSFEPSYNMAVNLLRRHTREQAESLLEASFAQFQADRAVAGLASRARELEQALEGYRRNLDCEHGDWDEYWRLRTRLAEQEEQLAERRGDSRARALHDGLAALQPGDVMHLPWLPARGLAAVVGIHVTRKGRVLAEVVTEDRDLTRIGPRELQQPPVVVDRVRLPSRGGPRRSEYRDQLGSVLRNVRPPPPGGRPPHEDGDGEPEELTALREQVRGHPCHDCPERDDHEVWQERATEAAEEAGRLRSRIERRTGSLVRQLDRIVTVLTQLGYLAEGDERLHPTPAGMRLAGIYSDLDLLVAEALRRDLPVGLDPAELAGYASLFVYEPRGGEETLNPHVPTGPLASAVDATEVLADELRGVERSAGLDPMAPLDAGFVAPAWRWASGADLDGALGRLELSGGDFVRTVKQVADLLGQLRDVAGEDVADAARLGVGALRRGIVEA